MKVLVIHAHSYHDASVANKTIVAELSKLDNVEVRHLETLYPDHRIDVQAEQAALVAADVIVLQHPTFWFNIPALLKTWEDTVLHYGFAFGEGGDKLHGKKFVHSFTTGAGEDFYLPDNINIIEAPSRALAAYCGMDYQGSVVSFGYSPALADHVGHALDHAKRLIAKIQSL